MFKNINKNKDNEEENGDQGSEVINLKHTNRIFITMVIQLNKINHIATGDTHNPT